MMKKLHSKKSSSGTANGSHRKKLGFRDAPLAVLLTVFGAPIAVSSFTMAQQMGGDDKLAGQLVVFSSIFSIGTMFLLIFFLREMAFL